MKAKISIVCLLIAFSTVLFTGCGKGPAGPAGIDGTNGIDGKNSVYYSEWFTAANGKTRDWVDATTEWYFDVSAPDLTQSIVESGVILGYVWLAGDLYNATTVRPLPTYAIGANWDFLIHNYQEIQFTSTMATIPSLSHKFRFIAIPGTIPALKSASLKSKNITDLRSELKTMPYKDVCKLFNIPE